jgi:hypothetical protein
LRYLVDANFGTIHWAIKDYFKNRDLEENIARKLWDPLLDLPRMIAQMLWAEEDFQVVGILFPTFRTTKSMTERQKISITFSSEHCSEGKDF